MDKKTKILIASNHTLDKYLKPKSVEQQFASKRKQKIKVPPSSGLPPATLPQKVILRYPVKPQLRYYQQEIVIKCICSNTLVCLPTGLGKTHIAAILISNFSKWFPEQKIIFLAPTRPLVRQQVSVLKNPRYQVPRQLIIEANGQLAAKKRQQLYEKHQIIFATPQTIENDLKCSRIDGKKIILIILDECHRSVGNSSYAQIIRYMNTVDIGYRIIGLSATPGSEQEKIQEVISNLNIHQVIYKDQQDEDVKRYLHEKIVKQIEIPQDDIIKESLLYLNKFANPSIGLLLKFKLFEPWMIRNGLAGTSDFLLREKFNQNVKKIAKKQVNIAYSAMNILRFLFRGWKSLAEQGYQTFKIFFFGQIEEKKCLNSSFSNNSKQDNEIQKSKQITLAQIQDEFSLQQNQQQPFLRDIFDYYSEESNTLISKQNETQKSNLPLNFRKMIKQTKQYKKLYEHFHQSNGKNGIHPKLLKLVDILKTFFKENEGRVMVFTHLRMTAKQIKDFLEGMEGIRAELFLGQSKTFAGQDEESGQTCFLQLKQKDQLQVINRFKKGEINTLISTSIGEQGLDIGEVDCIICYDGGHSPIRNIQRKGRTGRKRTGFIYILMMEGKQTQDFKKGVKKQKQMKDILRKNVSKFQYYPYNSSLFEQNSYIPIEQYESEIDQYYSSSKKTKAKKQKENQTDKPKKTKRRSKKGQVQSQISQGQLNNEQEVEIKITTIENLIDKYQQDGQETNDHQNQNLVINNIEDYVHLDKLEFQQSVAINFQQQKISQKQNQRQILLSNPDQQKQKQQMQQLLDFDSPQENRVQILQEIQQNCNSQDEYDQLIQMYQQNKKKQQLKFSQISDQSISSNQIMEILQNLNKNKYKQLIDLDDFSEG